MFSATVVNPGKTSPLVPHPEGFALHLSQASLSASVKEKTRVSLMIKVADEEPVILCTLCAGVNDTVPLDQYVGEYAELSVEGSVPVHVTGYYSPEYGVGDDEDDEDDEGEDGYGLHPMDGIFGLHGEDEDEDEDKDEDDDEDEDEFDSEEFDAMAPPKEPSVIIEDITDKEEAGNSRALHAPAPAAEEGKKRKAATAADESAAKKQAKEQKHEQEPKQQQQEQKHKHKQQQKQKEQQEKEQQQKKKEEQQQQQEQKQQAKEQKQKQQQQQQQQKAAKTPEAKPAAGAAAQPVASKKGVKKFENGFEIHSTKMGDPHGKLAKAGKKVSVKYTGRLMNGKVFDKTGNKPFTFRLGVGEVIKGWDVGVEGMRVGDVRKLVIPPQMAYGSQKTGPIPPNSTLEFDVELVNVK